jgi:hypothetical protein
MVDRIDPDSLENFKKGIPGDSYLGILVNNPATGDNAIHLALAQRLDGMEIDRERYSRIGGDIRDPLPGAGGHGQLSNWAGVNAVQLGAGVAAGDARGFSIEKIDDTSFRIGTYRSGLNGQDDPAAQARPGFARGTGNELRTLNEASVMSVLTPLLVRELHQPSPDGRERSKSM